MESSDILFKMKITPEYDRLKTEAHAREHARRMEIYYRWLALVQSGDAQATQHTAEEYGVVVTTVLKYVSYSMKF